MGRSRIGYQIWCAECVCENYDDLSVLQDEGRLVAKEGVLKLSVTCHLCGTALFPRELAECLTFFWEGPCVEYAPWEEKYLELLPDKAA